MRLAPLLFAFILAACGNDAMATTAPGITATRLVLTPASATIDTAGTLQLHSLVSWSDGNDHTADVALTATGGTIGTDGLYHAAGAPGQYLVIAKCGCGLADTSEVTVVAQSGAALATASLTVTVNGLPNSTNAAVLLTGPGLFSRTITATTSLDSLAPGTYIIAATGIAVSTTGYTAAPASQSVTLAAGVRQGVTIAYAQSAAPTALPPHPRVWMTADRLAGIKAQAASNASRWSLVKSGADAQVARGTAYIAGDEVLLADLCEAYLGTSDARYATRAGAILTAVAVEADSVTRDSGYDFRFTIPNVTMALDWCYNGLTVGQRHQTATWLMNRADWVWPETNPSRTGAWGLWPSNNYYWGFMMTGPAALAAAGDDTLTGAVSGSNRPAYHQALVLRRWAAEAAPYFATDGAGGAWAEGTSYDSSWRVGRFIDAFLTVGQPFSNPWFEASVRYRFASSTPRWLYKIPFGAQARISTGDFFQYDRYMATDVLPSVGPNPTLAAQVQKWLALIGYVPTEEFSYAGTLAEELAHYDANTAPAADLSGLPKDFLAVGVGQFIYRTSWTDPNASLFSFESGSLTGANAANSLMIWKGAFWISSSANVYSVSGIEQATNNYNTMTIGGVGQNPYSANSGKIVATQVSDQLVVVRGQAKDAYSYPATRPLTDYLRTVAYLPGQDTYVVVDRATAVDPTQAKVWRWQLNNMPQISGNAFTIESPNHDARCFVHVLSPNDVVLGTETFTLGNTPGQATSYSVTVTPPARASDVIVTVLQCGLSSSPPLVPTAIVTGTSATVLVGGATVLVPLDETQLVTMH